MKIDFHLPNDFDAEVEYDPARRVLTVTPRATRGRKTLVLAGVAVTGDSGRVERALMGVNLSSGQTQIQRQTSKPAPTAFDTPEDPTKAKKAEPPAAGAK